MGERGSGKARWESSALRIFPVGNEAPLRVKPLLQSVVFNI